MGDAIERIPAQELMWDTARIQRDPTGQNEPYVATAIVSPTALLGAVWWMTGAFPKTPYFWRITFSTDTNISWQLYTCGVDPGLPKINPSPLGNNASTSLRKLEAGVAAPPAIYYPVCGGFAAAGAYFDILRGGWLVLDNQRGLALVTAAVAANCQAAFWWDEH